MKPILLIHGGAGSRKPSAKEAAAFQKSLQRIVQAAYPILARGGSAVNAVAYAVELLENDPLFNAGRGSKLQSDGKIRMSASLMDGARRRFAGCINVERIKNPIRLAQKLLKFDSRVLAEKGAEAFARKSGLAFSSPYIPERVHEHRKKTRGKTGTVGAVALDCKGRLAAGTSTGGRGFEHPHRVSDSATIAGNFANKACAVSATGVGEEIVEFAVAASLATQSLGSGSLSSLSRSLLKQAKKGAGHFGFIAVDKSGKFFAGTSTPHLTWAVVSENNTEIHP